MRENPTAQAVGGFVSDEVIDPYLTLTDRANNDPEAITSGGRPGVGGFSGNVAVAGGTFINETTNRYLFGRRGLDEPYYSSEPARGRSTVPGRSIATRALGEYVADTPARFVRNWQRVAGTYVEPAPDVVYGVSPVETIEAIMLDQQRQLLERGIRADTAAEVFNAWRIYGDGFDELGETGLGMSPEEATVALGGEYTNDVGERVTPASELDELIDRWQDELAAEGIDANTTSAILNNRTEELAARGLTPGNAADSLGVLLRLLDGGQPDRRRALRVAGQRTGTVRVQRLRAGESGEQRHVAVPGRQHRWRLRGA